MKKIKEFFDEIRSLLIDASQTSGPSWFFYDPQLKIKGLKWRIHMNDEDTLPSIPHLHSIEKALKLNVYNGRIYDAKTGKHTTTANYKNMSQLWSDQKMVSIIMDYRERYKDKYSLPDIPVYAVAISGEKMSVNAEQYEISF